MAQDKRAAEQSAGGVTGEHGERERERGDRRRREPRESRDVA